MKKLEIIIPHYKEKEEIIEFNLRMLSLQQNINFNSIEVLIVNDGEKSYQFSEDFLNKFSPLKIKQITKEKNEGPGMARQYGVDHSSSKFIMFIDADDGLSTITALYNYFKAAKDNSNADLIESNMIYETYDFNDNKIHLVRENFSKNTWLHSKMLKRSFLEKYNIRFFDDIRVSEDIAFCLRMNVKNMKRYFIPYDMYYYRSYRNNSSICKSEGDDKLKLSYLEASQIALKYRFDHLHLYNDSEMFLFRTLTYAYFLLFNDWNNEENKKKFEDTLFNTFITFFSEYNKISEEEKYDSFSKQLKSYIQIPDSINEKNYEKLKSLNYSDMEKFLKEKIKGGIN